MRLGLKISLGKLRKLTITAATGARPVVAFLPSRRHYRGQHRRPRNGKAARRDTVRLAPIRPANVRLLPPAR